MFRLVIGSVHLEHDTNGYIGNIYCMKMFALSRSLYLTAKVQVTTVKLHL